MTFSKDFGTLNKTEATTDQNGYATVKLSSNTPGKAIVSAKVSGVGTEVKATTVEFFAPLSIDGDKVTVIGTGITGLCQRTGYSMVRLSYRQQGAMENTHGNPVILKLLLLITRE